MGIETDWEQLDTSYGVMRMYTARPDSGTAGPGVLVVTDRFGVTPHVEEVIRRFASEGIIALAPDLYHKFPTRAVSYDDPAAAAERRAQLSENEIIDDLTAALRFLGARGEVRSGLCGAVGFGDGARDAFLLATRNQDVLALVSFYGSIASEDGSGPIEASAEVLAPMIFFYGDEDESIPADEVERVRDTLESQGKDVEIVSYPAENGFFCEARADAYDEKAAVDAWTRTVDFIYQWLEG